MKTESGLVALAWLESDVDPDLGFLGLIAHDRDVEGSFPVVRLSDAEAIIAKLRDALRETEAYHKRMVAAKDSEIERLKNDLADALDMKVGKGPTALSWQADRIEKQSAALKLAREALETCDVGDCSTGHVIDPSFDAAAVDKALAAIDALKGE